MALILGDPGQIGSTGPLVSVPLRAQEFCIKENGKSQTLLDLY